MAQFGVDLQKLTQCLTDLKSDHKQFDSEVTSLRSSEKTLSGKWEGEAKNAFESAFTKDAAYMDNFSKLLTTYENALREVIDAYRDAESTNITTGNNRTYGNK